jgi:hypothetical protein
MSVIEERNAEIRRPQLKLIAQGRSRVLDVPPEVGNRDRVSIKMRNEALKNALRTIRASFRPRRSRLVRRSPDTGSSGSSAPVAWARSIWSGILRCGVTTR